MPLDHWLAFVAAASILLAIPGPTALLVISHALGHGRRRHRLYGRRRRARGFHGDDGLDRGARRAACRVGGAVHGAEMGRCSLSDLPRRQAMARAGVGRHRRDLPPAETHLRRLLLHAYAVTALNPKSIVFFVAFLPQFVDPGRPVLPQFAIFEATFLILATCNALAYAKLASAARRTIRKPQVQRAVNRTGGSLLIGAERSPSRGSVRRVRARLYCTPRSRETASAVVMSRLNVCIGWRNDGLRWSMKKTRHLQGSWSGLARHLSNCSSAAAAGPVLSG